MMAAEPLCRFGELSDPGTLAVSVVRNGVPLELCVVRRADQVFAYVNHCPHAGSPLDWVPGQFLDLDKRYIQCSTHHALFEIGDGECVAGPCVGERLTAVPVEVRDGAVYLVEK